MTRISDLYHFALLPEIDEQAFLTYVQSDGFALASVTRAGTVTSQYVLREHAGEDGKRRYLWVVHWTLHFDLAALEQIPDSLWKAHPHLQAQAELVSYARYIELAESISPEADAIE